MATADAPDCFPGSTNRPVQLDRLDGVLTTRRCVPTTGPKQRADAPLVEPNAADQQSPDHRRSRALDFVPLVPGVVVFEARKASRGKERRSE